MSVMCSSIGRASSCRVHPGSPSAGGSVVQVAAGGDGDAGVGLGGEVVLGAEGFVGGARLVVSGPVDLQGRGGETVLGGDLGDDLLGPRPVGVRDAAVEAPAGQVD